MASELDKNYNGMKNENHFLTTPNSFDKPKPFNSIVLHNSGQKSPNLTLQTWEARPPKGEQLAKIWKAS